MFSLTSNPPQQQQQQPSSQPQQHSYRPAQLKSHPQQSQHPHTLGHQPQYPQHLGGRQDFQIPFLYDMSGPSNPPPQHGDNKHAVSSSHNSTPTPSSATSSTAPSSANPPTSKPSVDPVVSQALEIARESPDGAEDPTIAGILEGALSHLWSKVQAAPDTYVMSKDEFSLFNFYQHRFVGDRMAILARRRYWDHACA
ncbi:uncharacterized protein DNG_09387 [Cephalotrichum gorgonifer]|uniref:Uncharacterized protein n=1 Tax=Cephalotrichum gorgonifer TaxID=2041049 RepID=A0AAE8N775_9PEZI|nr:uncharacterized protein DNG_09387 [Cephalotrichum gorgonifer]